MTDGQIEYNRLILGSHRANMPAAVIHFGRVLHRLGCLALCHLKMCLDLRRLLAIKLENQHTTWCFMHLVTKKGRAIEILFDHLYRAANSKQDEWTPGPTVAIPSTKVLSVSLRVRFRLLALLYLPFYRALNSILQIRNRIVA